MIKIILIWSLIIPIAILNGGLRQAYLQPLLGEFYANILSGLLLCLAIFLIAYFCLPSSIQSSSKKCWFIGLLWVALTLIAETLIGIALGSNIEKIMQNYNMSNGNLWSLIVVFIGTAPWMVKKIRATSKKA